MPLTDADKKEIIELMAPAMAAAFEEYGKQSSVQLNAAITDRLKKFDDKLEERVSNINEKLAEGLLADPDEPGDGSGSGAGAAAPAGGGTQKVDPELMKLRKQVEALSKDASTFKEQAEAAKLEKRMTDAENALRGGLATTKVKKDLHQLTIDVLKARGAVQFNEDGVPMLRLPYASAKGQVPVPTDFAIGDGLEVFLKTPEAAHLLEAPTQGGSGQNRGTNGRAGGHKELDSDNALLDRINAGR